MSHGKDILEVLVAGGELVADLTRGATHDTAVAIVAGVRAIVGVMEDVAGGALTPAEADAALTELGRKLAANDAAADAKLRAKFGLGHEVADPTTKL